MTTERIIKSTDLVGGTLYGATLEKVRHRNENPEFTEEKPYTYIANIKTSTQVHGWIFVYDNKFFAAAYTPLHGYTSRVTIYNAKKNGNYDCVDDEIVSYNLYCDIEAAVDKFCKEYIHEEVAPAAIEEQSVN